MKHLTWFTFGVLNTAALAFDVWALSFPKHSYFLAFVATNLACSIVGFGTWWDENHPQQ